MQLRRLCVALIVLGLATTAAGREKSDTRLPREWREQDLKLYAAAPTVKELVEKTRPTMVTNHEEPFFIWAEPHKGAFAFTVAEAKKMPSGEWCLLSGGDGPNTFAHYPRSKIATAVQQESRSSPATYIAAPATHRKFGTLYMVAIARREGCLQGETRVFMLRSPKGQWRYVGRAFGPGGDDGGWSTVQGTSVRWTTEPKAPVKIVITYGVHAREANDGSLQRLSDMTLAGALPAKAVSSNDYVVVRRGDTYSELVDRLAKEEGAGRTPEDLKRVRPLLRSALRRINPGADAPRGLLAGSRLYLPNWDELERLCRP